MQKARIRRNYVRGQIGKPKSKRSSPAVPLAMRAAAALDNLHRGSSLQGDDDLVFGHPHKTPRSRWRSVGQCAPAVAERLP